MVSSGPSGDDDRFVDVGVLENQSRPQVGFDGVAGAVRRMVPLVLVRSQPERRLEVGVELVGRELVDQQPRHSGHVPHVPATSGTHPTRRVPRVSHLRRAAQPSKHLYSFRVSQTSARTWCSASAKGKVSAEAARHLITSCRRPWPAAVRPSRWRLRNVSFNLLSRRFLQVLKASCEPSLVYGQFGNRVSVTYDDDGKQDFRFELSGVGQFREGIQGFEGPGAVLVVEGRVSTHQVLPESESTMQTGTKKRAKRRRRGGFTKLLS